MKLEEAKRFLNKYGYICEDAFRNNTGMDDIYAIIDAHSWSPDAVAKKIIDHYKNMVKSIKSTKFFVTNIYKKPTKDNWTLFNSNSSKCVDELIKYNDVIDIDIWLENFTFYPVLGTNTENTKPAIDSDIYYEWIDKLNASLQEACKKNSSKSEYFQIYSKFDNSLEYDITYSNMEISLNIKPKKDLSKINKEKLIKEFDNLINEIVMDEDLNKTEYEAAAFALEVENELEEINNEFD